MRAKVYKYTPSDAQIHTTIKYIFKKFITKNLFAFYISNMTFFVKDRSILTKVSVISYFFIYFFISGGSRTVVFDVNFY